MQQGLPQRHITKKGTRSLFCYLGFQGNHFFYAWKMSVEEVQGKIKKRGDYSAALTEKSIACPDNTGDDRISSQVNLPSSPKQHKGLIQGKNCK